MEVIHVSRGKALHALVLGFPKCKHSFHCFFFLLLFKISNRSFESFYVHSNHNSKLPGLGLTGSFGYELDKLTSLTNL